MVPMHCAECLCIVQQGRRIVACEDESSCCCLDIPRAPGATTAPASPEE